MMELTASQANVALVRARGKIDRAEARATMAALSGAVRRAAPSRLLLELHDFDGWTLPALMEEVRFLARHRGHFSRVAITGNNHRARLVASAARMILAGQVRFFDETHEAEARAWVTEGLLGAGRPLTAPDGDRGDLVDEASDESFPASDPPGYTPQRM